MVNVFKENVPATSSSLQSAEIRENFEALYDKVRALEVQATNPTSTSLLVLGGPVYFRSNTSQQLKLIRTSTRVFDLTTSFGYKTTRDGYGTLSREGQSFRGFSGFESEGPILEVMISINSLGQLVFTESLAGQSNRLSSPFNIYFDDSEIPIALLFVEKNSEGVLQKFQQTDLTDIRPFVTTAFQNNSQISNIESQVQDNTDRIDVVESTLKTSDSLKVRMIPAAKLAVDLTSTTNTRVECLSGTAWTGITGAGAKPLKFAGGYVDFNPNVTTPSSGVTPAGTPNGVINNWCRALIYLEADNSSTDPTNNSKIGVIHGTLGSEPRYTEDGYADLQSGQIPLAYVLYKYSSTSTIYPLISEVDMGGVGNTNILSRIGFEFPIVGMNSLSTEIYDGFTINVSELEDYYSNSSDFQTAMEDTYFSVNDYVDIFDSNTRPIRRVIASSTFHPDTKTVTIQVSNSFGDISLSRSAKARSIRHFPAIEDVRPFVGIS
jgi:hypothetical protein